MADLIRARYYLGEAMRYQREATADRDAGRDDSHARRCAISQAKAAEFWLSNEAPCEPAPAFMRR